MMSHLRLQLLLLQKCISIFWAHVLHGFVAWWFLVPMCDRDTNWMPGFIPSPHQDLHYSLFFPPTLLQSSWEHGFLWCCWQNMQLYNRCSNVKSGKLVFNPDFLLWACLIPDEDPIPLIQSPGDKVLLGQAFKDVPGGMSQFFAITEV